MDVVTPIAATLLLLIVGTGSWFDIRCRRLPNWLCGIALAGGIGLGLALGGWAVLPTALLHFAIALVLGIVLYTIGWIGAGDAKYYASLAAWFPLSDGPLLIVAVSLAGFALLIAWLPLRKRRKALQPSSSHKDASFDQLPYGVAIGVGAVVTFALTR